MPSNRVGGTAWFAVLQASSSAPVSGSTLRGRCSLALTTRSQTCTADEVTFATYSATVVVSYRVAFGVTLLAVEGRALKGLVRFRTVSKVHASVCSGAGIVGTEGTVPCGSTPVSRTFRGTRDAAVRQAGCSTVGAAMALGRISFLKAVTAVCLTVVTVSMVLHGVSIIYSGRVASSRL